MSKNLILYIAVVESWMTSQNSDSEIYITDYNIIRKDRISGIKTKGGGLILFYRQEIPVIELTSRVNTNIECMWVKIHFKSCRPIIIGVFYRPPDSNEEQYKFLV